MIRERVGNREKLIFMAGGGIALILLALVSVHAAGAESLPSIEAYGGDIDVHGNDIRNVGEIPGFFDTACTGSQVVSQVYDNGSYRCSDVSNTLSDVLASDNSAGANNLDMNGNNVTGVSWLNPDGQWLNMDTNITLSPDGDSLRSGHIHNAGVIYAQAISGADAPTYNFQISSENDLRFVADRDASNGGAWIWILDEDDGSLNAEGNLNMSDHVIEHVANPTSDTAVGDRGYNDARYVELSGDTMSGNLNMNSYNITSTHGGTEITLDLSRGDLLDTNGNTFTSGPSARLSNAHLDLRNNLLAGTEAVYPDASGSLTTDHMLDFDFGGDVRLAGPGSIGFLADSDGSDYLWEIQGSDGSLSGNGNQITDVAQLSGQTGNGQTVEYHTDQPLIRNNDGGQWMAVESAQDVRLVADADGSEYRCWIDDADGEWMCDGTKSWVHALNQTHSAVYTSQESPEVRAVIEDTTTVESGKTIVEFPEHFSETVGSAEDMTVQVTPHSLATVAAVQRNTTHVTIAADRDVAVDYRVTGIRDGYEDKQVVRQQADN